MLISKDDHARIAAAIGAAEANTSGEIFAILSTKPIHYRQTAFAAAILVAMALPVLLLLGGFNAFDSDWQTAPPSPARVIAAMTALQVVAFLIVLGLVWATPLNRWLTPLAIRRDRVHAEAMAQFLSKGLHVTRARTGVLIYAALHDRIAEVIADEGIYTKVPPETWGETTASLLAAAREGRLADGFVDAISHAGAVLAAHFPPGVDNPNELPNVLVEL